MKKIIASAVVAAATLSASQAAVFNGYSAGISAGTLTSKNTIKTTATGFQSLKNKAHKTFGTYGVHFDYDHSRANAFYWGLGLDFMLYSGHGKKTTANNTNSFKYRWSTELDARFGYNICNNAVVYALAGLRLYDKSMKSNTTLTNATTSLGLISKKSKPSLAPTLGAGVKAKVAANVSAGVEYRYAFEDNQKFAGFFDAKQKWTQGSHAVLAKVSYHF